jgi:hypothetical protein
MLAVVGAAFLALFSVVMTGIKSSAVYQQALELAATNQVLIERLGSPIRPGRLVTGQISQHTTVGDSQQTTGEARLRIAVAGPRAKATLVVQGERLGEEWTIRRLEALVQEERLNLLGR